MNDEHDVRYVLAEQGMRFLASRAGVPYSTFARHGGIIFVPETEQEPAVRAVRHVEHALGLNRFIARLARDARERGWLLAEWRNEAESTCRFTDQSGRLSWVRPDGSGVIATGAACVPFLIEYDRGTLDAGDYRGKLEGYGRYYASRAWQASFGDEPVLLFVCADDRAERRVLDAARSAYLAIPMFTTAEWRYVTTSAASAATFEAIWHGAAAVCRRALSGEQCALREGAGRAGPGPLSSWHDSCAGALCAARAGAEQRPVLGREAG